MVHFSAIHLSIFQIQKSQDDSCKAIIAMQASSGSLEKQMLLGSQTSNSSAKTTQDASEVQVAAPCDSSKRKALSGSKEKHKGSSSMSSDLQIARHALLEIDPQVSRTEKIRQFAGAVRRPVLEKLVKRFHLPGTANMSKIGLASSLLDAIDAGIVPVSMPAFQPEKLSSRKQSSEKTSSKQTIHDDGFFSAFAMSKSPAALANATADPPFDLSRIKRQSSMAPCSWISERQRFPSSSRSVQESLKWKRVDFVRKETNPENKRHRIQQLCLDLAEVLKE